MTQADYLLMTLCSVMYSWKVNQMLLSDDYITLIKVIRQENIMVLGRCSQYGVSKKRVYRSKIVTLITCENVWLKNGTISCSTGIYSALRASVAVSWGIYKMTYVSSTQIPDPRQWWPGCLSYLKRHLISWHYVTVRITTILLPVKLNSLARNDLRSAFFCRWPIQQSHCRQYRHLLNDHQGEPCTEHYYHASFCYQNVTTQNRLSIVCNVRAPYSVG